MDNVTISSVEGNRQLLDGGAMFGNAPKAMWQKWLTPDDQNRIELACRGFLITIGNHKILLETGIGAFFEPKLADRFGVTPPNKHVLLDTLESKGIKESEIDYVILSHLHFDHAGGLLLPHAEDPEKTRLLFSNAKYIVGEKAWQRANNPHGRDRASFIPELIELMKNSGRVELIKPSDEKSLGFMPSFLRQHLHFIESNGHTPGQLHTHVKSDKTDFFFCGDLIPGTTWAHIPLTMGYDRYPELLIDEKQNLYDSMNLERTIFLYTHDNRFVASKIRKNEKGKYESYEQVDNYNQVVF